ncbi:RepB family plasmid replication initiator protein [Streptosporangium sp. NPDC023615]|uniref:RepB family plasmid replication initiator protein n=1 Tax=Streptosporangium sp. NPDC023615 TaxID=3154794 RepID=UPI003420EE8C
MEKEVEPYEKKYPKSLVVMQNRMLRVFYEMTLDEKRILLLASPLARTKDASQDDAIEVTAKEFADACDIEVNSAYNQLKDASDMIMGRVFSYKNERGKKVNVQWVIRSIYEDGYVSLWFTQEVLEMLKVFDKKNPFTKYKKDEVLKLRGEYAIDIYHLAKRHEGMNHWAMTLDDIREDLSLSQSYSRINNLKSRVIDPAVKEISEKTDVIVTYENVKRGRTVTGLKFTVKAKPAPKMKNVKAELRDQNTADLFTVGNLSDKQIEAIVCTEAFKADYNHLISPTSPINTDFTLWKPEMSKRLKANPEQFSKRPMSYYLAKIEHYNANKQK